MLGLDSVRLFFSKRHQDCALEAKTDPKCCNVAYMFCMEYLLRDMSDKTDDYHLVEDRGHKG